MVKTPVETSSSGKHTGYAFVNTVQGQYPKCAQCNRHVQHTTVTITHHHNYIPIQAAKCDCVFFFSPFIMQYSKLLSKKYIMFRSGLSIALDCIPTFYVIIFIFFLF